MMFLLNLFQGKPVRIRHCPATVIENAQKSDRLKRSKSRGGNIVFKNVHSKFFNLIHSIQFSSSFSPDKPWFRILAFILLGLFSRFVPHPPNFTAFNTIALFSTCSLGSVSAASFTVFASLFLSDIAFGLHSSMIFIYLSFGLIVLMGLKLKSKRSMAKTTILMILSSLLFFIISNFGVWLEGSIYPKTISGLAACYIAAIPFLANNLLGTFFYGAIIHLIIRAQKWAQADVNMIKGKF